MVSELIILVEAMLYAGLLAAIYGAYAYLASKLTNAAEPFDPDKLIGTILVAFILGVILRYLQIEVTESIVITYLITIGAVENSQKFLKPIFNWIREKLGLPARVFPLIGGTK